MEVIDKNKEKAEEIKLQKKFQKNRHERNDPKQ